MRMIATGAQRLISAILDCEKPVIVGLNGTAAGLGAHLTLAADLVIAAEGVKIIEVFVRRGIIPDAGGPYLLTRAVGPHKAKELAFFGDDLLAEDAAALGHRQQGRARRRARGHARPSGAAAWPPARPGPSPRPSG